MITENDIDGIPAKKLNRALRRCHELQFSGKDWQGVAIDAWNELGTQSQDVFDFLSSTPDPYCECGFCKTAEWQD